MLCTVCSHPPPVVNSAVMMMVRMAEVEEFGQRTSRDSDPLYSSSVQAVLPEKKPIYKALRYSGMCANFPGGSYRSHSMP